MLRSLSIVMVLFPFAIGGYLFMAQNRTESGSAGRSAPILRAAGQVLEAHHRVAGTYSGVQIAVGGVRVVRADSVSYCVEALGMHLAGPGGKPAPGSC
jgi:hypothetical protein